jgi:hypothetical protein
MISWCWRDKKHNTMVYIDPNEVPKPDQRSLMTKLLAASNVIQNAAIRGPSASHIPIPLSDKQLETAKNNGWIVDDVLTVPVNELENFFKPE